MSRLRPASSELCLRMSDRLCSMGGATAPIAVDHQFRGGQPPLLLPRKQLETQSRTSWRKTEHRFARAADHIRAPRTYSSHGARIRFASRDNLYREHGLDASPSQGVLVLARPWTGFAQMRVGVLGAQRVISRASHPARVRGLKHERLQRRRRVFGSHPARVRGLKHERAPVERQVLSRTPRGCVD